jgi:murein DD-endopeptidase MepM/ murein hydrolase activator NlpD
MPAPLKNFWVRLGTTLLAAFGLMGLVIGTTPRPANPPAVISDDALLTAEIGFGPEAVQRLLSQRRSPLADYRETVGEQTLSAAELFWIAAQHSDYGLSPKALITTLQLEDGLNWTQNGGLYAHLKAMALELQRGLVASADPAPAAPGGKGLALPRQNAATYALASYYAPNAKAITQVHTSLQDWAAAYRELFAADPAKEVAAKAPATNVGFMRLPFDNPPGSFYPVEGFFDHRLPGQIEEPNLLRGDGKALPGAHYSGCWRGVTCYSGHNATDFTMPTGTPLYAVASGKVIYRLDAEGGVIIDHGNGYRSLYWHMDKIIVNWMQDVGDGQLLGWSDNRGVSTHPHLHFGLRLVSLSKDVDPFGWWSTAADPVGAPSKFMWRGGLTADNGSAQMHLFYNQYWTRDTRGFGGSSWYTRSTTALGSSTNWGMWGTTILTPGRYTVEAYWPKDAKNTTAAVYQVWHNGVMTPVRVNQRTDGDRFVPLGTFNFDAGPTVVILTDLTPDAGKDQRVVFDALRWQGGPQKSYVPLMTSEEGVGTPIPGWGR